MALYGSLVYPDEIVYKSTSEYMYTHEHTSITVSGGHYQQWLEDISCGGVCGSTQISYYMMKI